MGSPLSPCVVQVEAERRRPPVSQRPSESGTTEEFLPHASEFFLPCRQSSPHRGELFLPRRRSSSSPGCQASPPQMLESFSSLHQNGELFLPNTGQAPNSLTLAAAT
uniref:Uncharacterized protein n=1 Tax=Oryza sativa subsp. japonica TaxID=39947 RepID=Q5Z6T6_ORYSJ|nr:hypothetical protein [Oryza sativa Japonica Group]BAD54333.1 hypothetical protein [Oryza sativa Japonica Group]